MPVLKYFLFVGPVLSLLLLGWSSYLGPVDGPVAAAQPDGSVVFQPTAPPPLAELPTTPEPAAEVPPPVQSAPPPPSRAKTVRKQHRKAKTRVVRRWRPPADAYAFDPRPSFFDWR